VNEVFDVMLQVIVWFVVLAVAWFLVAVPVGILLGKVISRRDEQYPPLTEEEADEQRVAEVRHIRSVAPRVADYPAKALDDSMRHHPSNRKGPRE
jgi:hypothetical protein